MLERQYRKGAVAVSETYSNFGFWDEQYFEKDFIFVKKEMGKSYKASTMSLTLDDARFLVETLNQIINYVEETVSNKVKLDDKVRITFGRFEGLTGIVKGINREDSTRPVHVKLDDDKEINNCAYFCHYDAVEKIE